MGAYGNVNVDYSPCKSVAQLKSAADYLLGIQKKQVEAGEEKTKDHLYNAFGCNRDNFANSILVTRRMHGKSYSKLKQSDILAHKISISFHPENNEKLTYEDAYKIGEEFARNFFDKSGFEVLFAVHVDKKHVHVHFLVSNCNLKDGKSYRRGIAELKEMSQYFGEQCQKYDLNRSVRESFYNPDKKRERLSFSEMQMNKRNELTYKEEIKCYIRLAVSSSQTKNVDDVVKKLREIYRLDIRYKGNTISYALPYRVGKTGKPLTVRGTKLGNRFTVKGIEEALKEKDRNYAVSEELKRNIYEIWMNDEEYKKAEIPADAAEVVEVEMNPYEPIRKDDSNLSYFEGYDAFLTEYKIATDKREVFYGEAFDDFTRIWSGGEDIKLNQRMDNIIDKVVEKDIDFSGLTMEERAKILPEPTENIMAELKEYQHRMKGNGAKEKYVMRIYDEFLEEYEFRKKIKGMRSSTKELPAEKERKR